jgi:hypothetical protein
VKIKTEALTFGCAGKVGVNAAAVDALVNTIRE